MKFILFFCLLFPFVTSADNLSDSNKLFDFAEINYPEFFSQAEGPTYELGAYLVRYYPERGYYLGTKDGQVWAYGDIFGGLLKLGKISDYVELEPEGDAVLAELFADGLSDVQVQGVGEVIAILADDLQGSRHQRFIIKLVSGQTLLVAHNIDLAPRVSNLSVGDRIEFFGEYEWNEKGGVIHWTHSDPIGKHIAGWLSHNDIVYQAL
ncbi:hypothetical protein BPUTEOMOX_2262 [methanotrophic endosymbiont of Bathymodiolus puteoserpentis (Logatchev)]|jgi:hypothetical protein|nr:hypothetical protein BPUTEOMOX_2262 [methanotrophic endosymbiont of Bathymodiolus puteoserpentis (Logatchev)]